MKCLRQRNAASGASLVYVPQCGTCRRPVCIPAQPHQVPPVCAGRQVCSRARARSVQTKAAKEEAPAQAQPAAAADMAGALSTLVIVTMLWGSYNPVIRWLYDSPHHLEPATLTGIRTAIAAGALAVALAVKPKHEHKHHPDISASQESETSDDETSRLPLTPEEGTAFVHQQLPAAGSECDIGQRALQASTATPSTSATTAEAENVPFLARTSSWVLIAGIELGIYNFLGTSLQAMGLQLTSATRAGFLVQLTAVLVPVLSALAGVKVSSRIWGAAVLALSGTCLIALDGAAPASDALSAATDSPIAVGDLYLLGACLFYSLATVRLGFSSPKFNSVDLTAVKKFTLGAASMVWLASATASFDGLTDSIGQQTPWDWFLIAYSALGPGALATYLQTKGQATVPATLAQVVYSLTPIWSAIMAFLVLGDDGMGPKAWAGSGAILVASLIATWSGNGPQLPFKLPAMVGAGASQSTTDTQPASASGSASSLNPGSVGPSTSTVPSPIAAPGASTASTSMSASVSASNGSAVPNGHVSTHSNGTNGSHSSSGQKNEAVVATATVSAKADELVTVGAASGAPRQRQRRGGKGKNN